VCVKGSLFRTLAELEEATHTDAEMGKMAASTFSRYTNDRRLPRGRLNHVPATSHSTACPSACRPTETTLATHARRCCDRCDEFRTHTLGRRL
jgi:hypothetical protein